MSSSAQERSSPSAEGGKPCSIFWRSGPAPLNRAPAITPAVTPSCVCRMRDESILRWSTIGDAMKYVERTLLMNIP